MIIRISQIISASEILMHLYSIRQDIKIKKHFCRYCLQCFSSERALQEHRDMCLEINGKQSVNLQIDSIKFKKYFKQTALPYKIYTDAKYILVKIHINNRDKKNFIY